jgi:hypothetical protein
MAKLEGNEPLKRPRNRSKNTKAIFVTGRGRL